MYRQATTERGKKENTEEHFPTTEPYAKLANKGKPSLLVLRLLTIAQILVLKVLLLKNYPALFKTKRNTFKSTFYPHFIIYNYILFYHTLL